MTPTLIGVIILGAALVGIAVFFLCADVILGLRHRGEATEGHADDIPGADPLDAHFATACPLEYVPPIRHPGLWDFEQEMAGTPAARLATRLTTRSNQ